MAEIRQGYLDDYTQITSGNIGIGTSVSNEKLEIIGGTTAQELNVTGIATFTSVSGFIKKKSQYIKNVSINDGNSGTLSGEIIVGSGLTMTVGTAATASQGSVNSMKVYKTFTPPSGTTATRPAGKPGSLFYNFDFKTLEFFDGANWNQVETVKKSGRGVFCGGNDNAGMSPMINSINISTRGRSVDFGTMVGGRTGPAACANEIRGLIIGGSVPGQFKTDIDYFSMESGGQATDYGDLLQGVNNAAAASSSTRAFRIGGGQGSGNPKDMIRRMHFATLGEVIDFGDLTEQKPYADAAANPTRAVMIGGGVGSPAYSNKQEYIIMASEGNAVEFGTLSAGMSRCGTVSNTVRAVHHDGGSQPTSTGNVFFITTASLGNSIEFGELDPLRNPQDTSNVNDGYGRGCSNGTRAVWLNGKQATDTHGFTSSIEIASGGTSTSFGDAERQMSRFSAASNAHGGLGGF